jgi:hypothetical protein
LRIAPTLNINLPHNLFFTLYPSPVSATQLHGRMEPTEHTVISAEFGIPIIKDFPAYTFKTQLRVGYLF